MYNNASKSGKAAAMNTKYILFFYCKKTNSIALKYNNIKLKGKRKGEKRHPNLRKKKKNLYIYIFFVLIVINELKRFYSKGNLSKKHTKSRQSFERFVFVNKTFTI